MADIHNRLYKSTDIARIDFGDFIGNLAADIVSSNSATTTRIDLAVDLAPVTLNIDTAIPCSLIIGELLSNSAKHAFVGRAEGTIRISLDQHDDSLHLRVEDDGVGMPDTRDWEASGSLGLKLVRALVEQLDGAITFSNENGTRISLKLVAD